jgi:holo-[acyl-carrier protein] synthase
MVKGIGIDLVDKLRFDKLVKIYGNKIAIKILSTYEYREYEETKCKSSYLSKKFAAKEALSKALGYGLYRNGVYPKSISVKHTQYGKPFFEFSDSLLNLVDKSYTNIELSISDTCSQSIAFVVIES